jgi:hypothetical protein
VSKKEILTVVSVSMAGFLAVQLLTAQQGSTTASEQHIRAKLNGWNEVPTVITDGEGAFRATINAAGAAIDYELEFEKLSGPPTMAHIHIGQRFANGGVSVWICHTTQANVPAGTPVCPAGNAGKVTGRWTAASIVGPAAQGIPANPPDMGRLLAALRARQAYVNVHTAVSPAGEIRGQIMRGRGPGHDDGKADDDDDDDDDDDGPGQGKGKGAEKSGGRGKG